MTFGQWVNVAREVKGMTIQDVSKATGISISHLSLIENSRRNPSLSTASRIANALGVELWKALKKVDV